jgi:hypothetical protein
MKKLIVALLLIALAACEDRDCDPGQHYADGLCYADVDGGAAVDAPTDAGVSPSD